MALSPLKDLVPGLVKKIGVTPDNFQVLSLIERGLSAAGGGARVVAFKNNKIYVEVDSSVHLYDFNLKKREILKSISGAFAKSLPGAKPELKFFLKGTARPTREERLKAVLDKTFKK